MTAKGFTLIEVIAVVGIIGILAAAVIPAITGHKNPSKQTECRAGYQFDTRSGHQIIGSNGGGVLCDVVVKQ